MAFRLAVVLLTALVALFAPVATADHPPSDEPTVHFYPHCMNVIGTPRTCLCPWPPPAHMQPCPIPGP